MATDTKVAKEIAARALEDVRMKAKREWTELLRDRLKYMAEHTRDQDEKKGLETAVWFLTDIIQNPANWRT